jgi:hypothetical protein
MKYLAQLLIAAALASSGCQSLKTTDAQHPSAPVEEAAPGELEHAMQLWRSGNTDEAMQMYVTVASDERTPERDLLVIHMSEDEYRALPASEQTRVLEDWLGISRDLRIMTRAVLDTQAASPEGDRAARAVARVGAVHAKPERALIAQKTGEAILRELKDRELLSSAE